MYEDERCWIAECEICAVPMVVWREHGDSPPEADVSHMIDMLQQIAIERYGLGGFSIDRVMRQIPDHFHAHARGAHWWTERFEVHETVVIPR